MLTPDVFTSALEALQTLGHNEPGAVVLAGGLAIAVVIRAWKGNAMKPKSKAKAKRKPKRRKPRR